MRRQFHSPAALTFTSTFASFCFDVLMSIWVPFTRSQHKWALVGSGLDTWQVRVILAPLGSGPTGLAETVKVRKGHVSERMGRWVHPYACGFQISAALHLLAHFSFSHLSSPPALSCSVCIFRCMPAGTGTAQNGWNGLWGVSLLWCFQICFQVSQTENGCFFWSHASLPLLWHWNREAHERLHFPVVSISVVLWNLFSILSSENSDATTRWQCYQQLHTSFPSLDSENLNSEETRNTETGKAMATLPCVHPWSGEMHTVLSWKRAWRKATKYPRKDKQLVSENRFKEPKLPSSPELRRRDPKQREIF